MFEYNICTNPNEDIYKKQCKALEKNIPNIKKIRELHDVDDTKIMIYEKDGKEIIVKNSYYVGAVFIESEIELEQFFKNK